MKKILATFFWLWGAAGLILVGMEIVKMMDKLSTDVGVGTSSFSAAISLFWIGGMLFFGLGAMLSAASVRAVVEDPYGDVRIAPDDKSLT